MLAKQVPDRVHSDLARHGVANLPTPASILICGLSNLAKHVSERTPSHLLSLLTPAHMPATPMTVLPANHLKVACHDIVEPFPGAILPDETHLTSIIDFSRSWDGTKPMLIHCFAGVSRSTAAALVVAAARETRPVETLTEQLRSVAPHAHPNHHMISIADTLLELEGTFVAAVQRMGFGKLVDNSPLVELNVTL
jgi:predicted protein tyrosine phosphatase